MTQPTDFAAAEAGASPDAVAAVSAAAAAAAEKLPTAASLTPGALVSDPSAPVLPPGASAAVSARIGRMGVGELVIVVADDVVQALAASPLGKLELAPALQPALDAAAACFGGVVAEVARQLDPAVALGSMRDFLAVPLLADGEHRATVAVRLSPAMTPRPSASTAERRRGLELLRDVEMEVTVELGRTRMTVRELLSLAPGAVVELDRAAGSPADVLVNGTLIARGEVVVVDEDFGIRVTEIIATPTEELGS